MYNTTEFAYNLYRFRHIKVTSHFSEVKQDERHAMLLNHIKKEPWYALKLYTIKCHININKYCSTYSLVSRYILFSLQTFHRNVGYTHYPLNNFLYLSYN